MRQAYARELAQVLHRTNDGDRLMAMFQAIGDESYFHSVESTPFYVSRMNAVGLLVRWRIQENAKRSAACRRS